MWKGAIILSFTNPLTGVGVNCYSWAHFLDRVASGETYLRMHSVHNSLLEIAAEVGLIGFAVYMLMIVHCLRTFYRISGIGSQNRSLGSSELEALGGLMLLGFVGLLVSGFFLSQGYSMLTTLYFALAAVMERLRVSTTTPGIETIPDTVRTPGTFKPQAGSSPRRA